MKLRWRNPNIWTYVIFLGYAIALGLLVYPLFNIFRASFIDNISGELSFSNYQEVLGKTYYRTAILNSLIVSLGGMMGAVILGVPLAFFTARYHIIGKSVISTLAVMSLVSPPFIGAYSWIIILGRQGFLRKFFQIFGIEFPTIFGAWGIILVYSLQYYPFVFLLTSGALTTINRSLEESAENLGATAFRKFFKITLPLVTPSLTAGALIAFMLSLSNFGTPMLIGGRFRVLATMAYDFYTSEVGGNPGMASTLSIFLMFCAFVILFLQRYFSERRKFTSSLIKRPLILTLRGWKAWAVHAICYLIVFWSTLPLAVVIFFSFRKASGPVFQPGFGLQSYQRILPEVPRAIANSFLFALIAVVMIVVVGTLIGFVLSRYKNAATTTLDPLLMTPYIVPGTVLGIGFVIAFNKEPVFITGTGFVIILAYFIRRLPYAIRSSSAILKQIKPSIEEAAINLGAPPGRAFTQVVLPMMIPGVVSGAMLSFVTTINELSASIILYVGKTTTMPVRIYISAIDGDFGTGSALSTILLLVTGISIFVIYKVSGRGEEAFTG